MAFCDRLPPPGPCLPDPAAVGKVPWAPPSSLQLRDLARRSLSHCRAGVRAGAGTCVRPALGSRGVIRQPCLTSRGNTRF